MIRETLAAYPVDLIHMHSLDFHAYMPPAKVPVLATLHLPPDWYPESVFRLKRQNYYLNCVSASQRRACPLGKPGHDLLAFLEGRAVHRGLFGERMGEQGLVCGREMAIEHLARMQLHG